ncbi:Calcium-dependent protein kinase 25 [Asimina triloba]
MVGMIGFKRKLQCESSTNKNKKPKLEVFVTGLELGRGGYGCVRLCTIRANGMKFACKTTRKAGDAAQEIQIMHLLSGHQARACLI